MRYAIALISVALVGCEQNQFIAPEPDQCLRAELFRQCMQALPKGPERTHNSNDWDEVVGECSSAAYYQSLRKIEQIKPECQV
jgi:hypothetical protein